MNKDTEFVLREVLGECIEEMEIPYLISDTFCDVIENLREVRENTEYYNISGIEYDFNDVKKMYIKMVLEELDFDEDGLSELIGEP